MLELINKIHNCDNAEMLAQLPDKSLDLIIEDMPYNNTNLAVSRINPKRNKARMVGTRPNRSTNQPPRGAINAEQTAKIMIQVQIWTKCRSSASSTIRQVQAVCDIRQRLFIKAAATKKRTSCAAAQIKHGILQHNTSQMNKVKRRPNLSTIAPLSRAVNTCMIRPRLAILPI